MKYGFKRVAALFTALTVAGSVLAGGAVVSAESELYDVWSDENATFTIMSSAGKMRADGSRALDRDYITTTGVEEYNGIPIYDINGNEGDDYIMLMTVEANAILPIEKIKMNWEQGVPYSLGPNMYLSEPVRTWATGFEIYTSNTGEKGSWEKVYSCASTKGMLKEENIGVELWDDLGGIRPCIEFTLDKPVEAKLVRIAIRGMEPWLGGIMLHEVFAYGSEAKVAEKYNRLSVNSPACAEYEVVCAQSAGADYILGGAEATLTVKPDDVSKINSVKLDGDVIEGEDGIYKFTMPEKDAVIDIDCGIKDDENVPLTVIETSVTGGEVVPAGTVPVVTFSFNNKIGFIDKSMILVNGEENSGLIQHAFADANNAAKAYVVPFSDKLLPDTSYTIAIKDGLVSKAGMPLDGVAEASFKTSDDYDKNPNAKYDSYIKGYGDGTFGPENNITLNEALIIAERLTGGGDFSSIAASDRAATRAELAEIIYIVKNKQALESKEDMFAALVQDGVIQGYEDGTYRRENPVTRAEAVTMFNRSLGRSGAEEAKELFTDVPSDYWAAADIAEAVEASKSTTITWVQDIPEVESFDTYNKANDVWETVPCVSQELRDMGVIGGEGGQWMQSIECDNVDGQLLFAGVDIGGMMRSTDGGKTWHRSYRGFMAKGTVDIDIDPNNKNRVLAVGSCANAPYGGLYLSEDMGYSWTHVCSFIFGGQRDTRDQLAWDKSTYDAGIGGSRVAYWSNMVKLSAGLEGSDFDTLQDMKTHHKQGLFKTTDGGKSWFIVNGDMSDSVVEVHPEKGYVYIGNERGFFRSEDGGVTFKQILEGEPIYGLDVIETHPDNVYINDSKGVLISEDCGKTFKRAENEGFPIRKDLSDVRNIVRDLAVSPANPNHMMVDDRDYINYKNYRYFTKDGGRTWAESGYDESKDFFFNHGRQHPYAWHPTDENKVWSLGGDWITSSNNGGETFIWDANGYSGTPPGGRIVFNYFTPEIIFGGVQDLLGILSTDNGYTWKAIESSSGFGCSYGTYSPDGKLLISANAAGWYDPRYINVSRDGGETWEATDHMLKNGLARRATSFFGSVHDRDTMFAGEYVSRDRADSWEEMVGCEMVMAINPHHNKEMWGLNKEVVVVSYDDGRTWLPFTETYLDCEEADLLKASIYSSGSGKHIWDLEYDGINDILYYMPGSLNSAKTLVKVVDNVHTNMGDRIHRNFQKGDKGYQLIALDPRYPEIIYIGGYGENFCKQTMAVQRSCDGGETFQILSSMGEPEAIVKDGPSTGAGPQTIVVQPDTGDVWIWESAEGLWKFPPPYEN